MRYISERLDYKAEMMENDILDDHYHSQKRDFGGRERDGFELGISRCKLLYIEWINNKVLL